MLSVKPWKFDAIARFIVSVFICIFSGSLLLTAWRYHPPGANAAVVFYSLLALALICLGVALWMLRKPWQFENFVRQLAILLLFFYAGLIGGMFLQAKAGHPTSSIGQIIVGGLSFQGASLLLARRFIREHGLDWNAAFGLHNQSAHSVLLGITVACIFLPIGLGLQWASAEIVSHLPRVHLEAKQQEAVQTLQSAATGLDWVSAAFIIILVVPPAEEILFRGILYPAIKQSGFPRLALWTTAVVFAAIHLNLISFIPLTLLALILTLLYERTNNLLAPITVHAIFNAVNLGRLYWIQHHASSVA